ncbi:energy transducer TonB [Edaphocola aurantiacus]|uniref:energy transducer TonB n=1 Tax=Edaphocola aurantiacus TaxID=2601682 RepID=UPI001C97AE79|nr:energy transducer TonB [Edaphocola aurantiacus]
MPARKYILTAVLGLLSITAGPFDVAARQQKTVFNCGDDIAIPPVDLKQYIKEHLRYPEQAVKEDIQGKVYISFIVDTAGMMHSFTIAKGKELGHGLPEEALRVVQSIPGKWKAAKKGDQPAPCYYTVPVIFMLE